MKRLLFALALLCAVSMRAEQIGNTTEYTLYIVIYDNKENLIDRITLAPYQYDNVEMTNLARRWGITMYVKKKNAKKRSGALDDLDDSSADREAADVMRKKPCCGGKQTTKHGDGGGSGTANTTQDDDEPASSGSSTQASTPSTVTGMSLAGEVTGRGEMEFTVPPRQLNPTNTLNFIETEGELALIVLAMIRE